MLQNPAQQAANTPLKADLHCHSHYSDGTHPPQFLLERAAGNGVDCLAITDHDCLSSFDEPLVGEQARALSIKLVAGLEISCAWQNQEIHVVGLCIDPLAQSLQSLVRQQLESRRQRLGAIAAKLAAAGVSGLDDFLAKLPAKAVTRSHAAQFLIASGRCKNAQKAFKQWLGKRGRAYVAAEWVSLADAIETINQAGGIAVLAHPSRYSLSRTKLARLLDDFQAAGGEALEVSYPNLDPLERRRLLQLGSERQLLASVGSDFHSSELPWNDLGKAAPLLPDIKNAIWTHARWHYWSEAAGGG